MECVTFHATELLGQDERLFLTEGKSETSLVERIARLEVAMEVFIKPQLLELSLGINVTGRDFPERNRQLILIK